MGHFQNTVWFEQLCAQSTETIYNRGESFSLQDEPLKAIGFIISGKANAVSFSVNGVETWVGEYSDSQFIGAVSLLSSDIPAFEVRAQSRLVVRVISQEKMLKLMQANVALYHFVATDLALRLNTSMNSIIDLNSLSVKGRICSELMRLSLPIGINPDKHIIRPSPVFVDLARRLNSSRETVSRTVSELQGKGIIAREPGAMIIEYPDRLQDAIEYI